jgi:hypothetical protein
MTITTYTPAGRSGYAQTRRPYNRRPLLGAAALSRKVGVALTDADYRALAARAAAARVPVGRLARRLLLAALAAHWKDAPP